MKKFFKIFAVAALACVTFVACEKEFDEYTPAEPETGECYDVYFPESESSFELDPADPTSLTFPVARKNTAGAITVPVVVKVGGDVSLLSLSILLLVRLSQHLLLTSPTLRLVFLTLLMSLLRILCMQRLMAQIQLVRCSRCLV